MGLRLSGRTESILEFQFPVQVLPARRWVDLG